MFACAGQDGLPSGFDGATPLADPSRPAWEDAPQPRDPFRSDNRAGLSGTLHRISAIRARDRSVIGLTYRIGRHIKGSKRSAMSVHVLHSFIRNSRVYERRSLFPEPTS